MLIAVAGLPGTGKSRIARGLAGRLPAALLDKDPIRAALFAPGEIEHSTRQDDFCVGVMLQVAAYHWGQDPGRRVILDGRPFSRRYQRAEVAAFAALHGVPFRLIECICAEETAHRRLQRDAEAAAHPARNRDIALYLSIKSHFEPLDEPRLVLDTDEDYPRCLDRCLAYLAAPAEPAASHPSGVDLHG